jgi:hypothetical protein
MKEANQVGAKVEPLPDSIQRGFNLLRIPLPWPLGFPKMRHGNTTPRFVGCFCWVFMDLFGDLIDYIYRINLVFLILLRDFVGFYGISLGIMICVATLYGFAS